MAPLIAANDPAMNSVTDTPKENKLLGRSLNARKRHSDAKKEYQNSTKKIIKSFAMLSSCILDQWSPTDHRFHG